MATLRKMMPWALADDFKIDLASRSKPGACHNLTPNVREKSIQDEPATKRAGK